MNILMLEKSLEVGGVATFMKILSSGWHKQGHAVYLITADDGTNQKVREEFRKKGIQVLTVPYSTRRPVLLYRFVKAILALAGHTKIDIMHSQHRLTHFAALIAGKLKRIPRLLTFHAFKKDHKLLTNFWQNEPVTVPSRALKKRYIDGYGFDPEQIQVIHNSIAPGYHVDEALVSQFKQDMFSNPDLFYVMYVGRLSYEKGVDVLIKSIPRVKGQESGIAFCIFGSGEEEKKLKKLCRKHSLDPSRLFYGTNPNINELLSLADVSVLPSRIENFSLFALESLRAGTPVVASNVGGMPELIEDRKTGLLVEPESPDDLAEGILKMYQDKKMRKQFARRGRERLTEQFSIDAFHRSYIQKCKQIIKAYRP